MGSLTFSVATTVVGLGILSFLLKEKVAAILNKIKLPRVLMYLIAATPAVIIEEFVNCEIQPFASCIVITLPVFYIMFVVLFAIQKFAKARYIKSCLVFGAIGTVNEFFLNGRIYAPIAVEVMAILIAINFMIHAVLAILPSYYFEKSRKH